MLTAEIAERFAATALGHVRREYPNKLTHGLVGPDDARTPRALHPVFFGSYDWHSCVHAYWMLAHLLRVFPAFAPADDIRALFEDQLTAAKIAGECDYFRHPGARGFERPYGWAWVLKLAAALRDLGIARWADAFAPLADLVTGYFHDFLPRAIYPVRVGTHFNTAFALTLAADHADTRLRALLADTAQSWYGQDVDCQAWEPSGDDFLSSALMEAACMQHLLPAPTFRPWFDRFLPGIAAGRPASLFTPAKVTDRSDGKIAHLDGLNLTRAWCWRRLAGALSDGDPRRPIMQRTARDHLAAGLPHVVGDYMGEHWMASFAVLALES